MKTLQKNQEERKTISDGISNERLLKIIAASIEQHGKPFINILDFETEYEIRLKWTKQNTHA